MPCYSSDYDNHPDKSLFSGRSDYRSQSNDGVYFGYKWQCVELARRYLVTNYGYTFGIAAAACVLHAAALSAYASGSDSLRLWLCGSICGSVCGSCGISIVAISLRGSADGM